MVDDEFKNLNVELSLVDEATNILDTSASRGYLENDNVDPKSTLDMEPVVSCITII